MPEEYQTDIDTSSTIPEELEPEYAFCEFCEKLVKIKTYEHHAKRCTSNPRNIHTPCPFCEKEFPSDLTTKHVIYCPFNPDNIKSMHLHPDVQDQVKNIEGHLKSYQKPRVDNRSGGDCPICLYEIKKNEAVRFLNCLHKYHEKCIADWTKQNKNCPICRTAIP